MSNVRIANDLLHLALKVKHHHWMVRGNDALPLHEQLDELFDDLIGYSDRLFEDALANSDKVSFQAALNADDAEITTDNVIKYLVNILSVMIVKTQEDGVDQDRRGTGNILDDVAEGLTNWVYLLRLYIPPFE